MPNILLPCGDGRYKSFTDFKHYYAYYVKNKDIEDKDNIFMWYSVFEVWNKYGIADFMSKELCQFYDKNFEKQCSDYEHDKFSPLCFPWVFEDYYINPFKYIKTTITALHTKNESIYDDYI